MSQMPVKLTIRIISKNIFDLKSINTPENYSKYLLYNSEIDQ